MNNEITIDGVKYVKKPINLFTESEDLCSANWTKKPKKDQWFKVSFLLNCPDGIDLSAFRDKSYDLSYPIYESKASKEAEALMIKMGGIALFAAQAELFTEKLMKNNLYIKTTTR